MLRLAKLGEVCVGILSCALCNSSVNLKSFWNIKLKAYTQKKQISEKYLVCPLKSANKISIEYIYWFQSNVWLCYFDLQWQDRCIDLVITRNNTNFHLPCFLKSRWWRNHFFCTDFTQLLFSGLRASMLNVWSAFLPPHVLHRSSTGPLLPAPAPHI